MDELVDDNGQGEGQGCFPSASPHNSTAAELGLNASGILLDHHSPAVALDRESNSNLPPSPTILQSTLNLFLPPTTRLQHSRSHADLLAKAHQPTTPASPRRSLDFHDLHKLIYNTSSNEPGRLSFRAKMAYNAAQVPGANAQTNTGSDLQEVAVEVIIFTIHLPSIANMEQSLAFKTFAGETKIKLLPSPWLPDSLPSSTSSLLSISSKRGLLAAAGPGQLVIAETKAVRDCFTGPAKIQNNIKDFTPALTIDVPRLSQVAFNADGSYLIICAESGGGLAVYDTAALLQNKREPTFQIATEGIAVRALAPNPAPDFAHLVAVVLGGGQLMIANLQTKEFVSGANGNKAVKEGVTSVSWSNKGKQLVAGLGDGSAFQMDPAGVPKAIIKQPEKVPPNHHVSTIVWLANDEFLMIHTPSSPAEPDRPPDSIIHYVQTDKGRTGFQCQTVNDPAGPFGLNRSPPTHYISRLRLWHNLTDMLIFASVVSTDVGLITQSTVPLASGAPVGVYTGTSFADDSQRASVPMSALDDMQDTTPIGMALDLSSTAKVPKPIAGDEMD